MFARLKRIHLLIALLALIFFLCLVLGTLTPASSEQLHPYLENIPYGPKLEDGVQHVVQGAHHVVNHLPNPLQPPAHPPPNQPHSSGAGASWFSDWKWMHPFSSSLTLDSERAVLPPLPSRPPIYTYYDLSQRRKDEKSRRAELELLKIWRRAWWAQGFKPIVLSRSDAVKNPLFAQVQHVQMERSMENELMRWLAWENMGTGIMANFLALPMAAYDNAFLSFLRRGEFPFLTRYDGLSSGLVVGSKEDIHAALKLSQSKSVDLIIPDGRLHLDPKPGAIAYYSENVIKDKYKPIGDLFNDLQTVGDGMSNLPSLLNAHLHMAWQNKFPKGVAVLQPLPEHTTAVTQAAFELATNLTECPWSPIQGSCPPNWSKCKPCVSNQLKISTPKAYWNESGLFTIGTVPHPLTLQSLVNDNANIDTRYIRRETERDVWIDAVTKQLLGNSMSSYIRLPRLKDAVASSHGSTSSLWFTAELGLLKDAEELDWILGFSVPRQALLSGKSETPVPGPERRPKSTEKPKITETELRNEQHLLQNARALLDGSGTGATARTRAAMEAWNMADTEAWKFIRAFNARRRMERQRWEKEESSYLGKGTLDRWKDRIA